MNDNKGRKMIEKYNLNGEKLPTLPTPHDCEIVEVECNDEFLIFKFANNLNCYDSIKAYCPEASSLVIKYHLIDSEVITYIKRKDCNPQRITTFFFSFECITIQSITKLILF